MIGYQLNTLRPRQNGRHLADVIFKCIFLNENIWISIKISLKFVPNGPIDNMAALVQIMAWRRPDDKPLSEPMMVSVLTHIYLTRPQWVYSPSLHHQGGMPFLSQHLVYSSIHLIRICMQMYCMQMYANLRYEFTKRIVYIGYAYLQ